MKNIKNLYNILGLEDPELFEKRMMTENLFRLNSFSNEIEISRRIGKSTNIVIESIFYLLEDKNIMIYCRDYRHLRTLFNLTLKYLNIMFDSRFNQIFSHKEDIIYHLNNKRNFIYFLNDSDINNHYYSNNEIDYVFDDTR